MIIQNGDQFTVRLGGAVTTNQLQWYVIREFLESQDSGYSRRFSGITDDTNLVQILDLPKAAHISGFNITNTDTVNADVYIEHNGTGLLTTLLRFETLAPNQSLQFTHSKGFFVV